MQGWWADGGEEKKILRLFVQRVTYVCVGKKILKTKKEKKNCHSPQRHENTQN